MNTLIQGLSRFMCERNYPDEFSARVFEDNVTIYSNASVLGGETVIGEGSVIAGSTFVTFSVPPHSRVSVKEQEIRVRQPGERD